MKYDAVGDQWISAWPHNEEDASDCGGKVLGSILSLKKDIKSCMKPIFAEDYFLEEETRTYI